ncbi:MAG: hypothetical protein QOF57_74 [Frankiaceae bacterium]|jgi:hypothetical protein|nr:hypothetical protein [Frankiaceae bacterium]
MTEFSEAPSLENPLDVVPNDETLGDVTAGDATRPPGEVNAYNDGADPRGDDGRLGEHAASDDLAGMQDGELVTDQEQAVDTPDDLGGVGGGQAGGAG